MTRMHASLLFEEVSLQAEQQIPAIDLLAVSSSSGTSAPLGSTVVSQWIADHPVMLLNRQVPTDRKRLTIAHDLGHLVLHGEHVSDDVEREANEFGQ
jgi:Zn-dependent peptidase ImmA (M78 family)